MDKLQWKQYWREKRLSMNEEWKPIEGYEGLYEISNLGRVKSIKIKSTRGKIMKNVQLTNGYLGISLSKDLKIKNFRVHRLVAIAFIPNPDNKKEVNHINGVKNNAFLSNLEWCTHSENTIHAFRTGLKSNHHFYTNNPSLGKFGKYSKVSRSVKQFTKDLILIKEWDSIIDVERELGIDHSFISRVCRFKEKSAGGFVWRYY